MKMINNMAEKDFLKKISDVRGKGFTTCVKSRAYVTKITTEDLHESAAMINHGHGGSVKNLINHYESKVVNGEVFGIVCTVCVVCKLFHVCSHTTSEPSDRFIVQFNDPTLGSDAVCSVYIKDRTTGR